MEQAHEDLALRAALHRAHVRSLLPDHIDEELTAEAEAGGRLRAEEAQDVRFLRLYYEQTHKEQ